MSSGLIALLTRVAKKKQELRTKRLQEPSERGSAEWFTWYDSYRGIASDLSVLKEEFLHASVREVFGG